MARHCQALLTFLMEVIFLYLGQYPQFPGSGTYLRVTLLIPVSGEFLASEFKENELVNFPFSSAILASVKTLLAQFKKFT